MANFILRARIAFRWALENELLDKPVRVGTSFKRPSAMTMRKSRADGGSRMIEADELRKIIEAAAQPLKAMILLGINCGYGASDCANLPMTAIKDGWITFPRPKTGIPRRCPLWVETTEAIEEALASRPTPKADTDTSTVFITKYRKRWVRMSHGLPLDAIGQAFTKILVELGIKRRGSFYNLRHVFRTITDGSTDRVAIDAIMGHADSSMGSQYRERIDDGRLLAVVNVVHAWLWPGETEAAE